MKLKAPCPPIDFKANDVYGNPIQLSKLGGKKVLLAFFRDAACPFCNLRLYELTNRHAEFQQAGMEIIAVFSSPAEEVKAFVDRHPRPFILIADPDLALYNQYGVEHSTLAMFKALLFRLPRFIGGLMKGAKPDSNNPHIKLVPADFLISEQGKVVESWYGRNTSDHLPMKRLLAFAKTDQAATNPA